MNSPRVKEVQFAVLAELILPVDLKRLTTNRNGREGPGMLLARLLGEFRQANAAYAGGGPGKIAINQLPTQTDGLKYLRATVRLNR